VFRIHRSVVVTALVVVALSACAFQPQPTASEAHTSLAPATPIASAPRPSPTRSAADSVLQAPTSPSECAADELDRYVAVVSPLLDQIVDVARDATQREALSEDRVTALLDSASLIRDQILTIRPPSCLEDAHLAAVGGATLLVKALDGIASGSYVKAEEDLRGSFEQVSLAAALIAMQYWAQSPTPTPRP